MKMKISLLRGNTRAVNKKFSVQMPKAHSFFPFDNVWTEWIVFQDVQESQCLHEKVTSILFSDFTSLLFVHKKKSKSDPNVHRAITE